MRAAVNALRLVPMHGSCWPTPPRSRSEKCIWLCWVPPMARNQFARDALAVVAGLVMAALFVAELVQYLAPLQRPFFLVGAFTLSLMLAILYDLKAGFSRYAVSQAVATIAVVALAALFAPTLHDQYNDLMADFLASPEISEMIGSDYVMAFKNRAVGFGGSYAASLGLTRLFLYRPVARLAVLVLITADHRPRTCTCCGQFVIPAKPKRGRRDGITPTTLLVSPASPSDQPTTKVSR